MSWCKKGGYSAQISPKSEVTGFKWANTLTGRIITKPMSYVAALHLVPHQIRSQINTVPTPAVAWTGAWLNKGGGGTTSDANQAGVQEGGEGEGGGSRLMLCRSDISEQTHNDTARLHGPHAPPNRNPCRLRRPRDPVPRPPGPFKGTSHRPLKQPGLGSLPRYVRHEGGDLLKGLPRLLQHRPPQLEHVRQPVPHAHVDGGAGVDALDKRREVVGLVGQEVAGA